MIKIRLLFVLDGIFECSDRLFLGDFDRKHAIRPLKEYPAIQCEDA
jgi:hypothetical protein